MRTIKGEILGHHSTSTHYGDVGDMAFFSASEARVKSVEDTPNHVVEKQLGEPVVGSEVKVERIESQPLANSNY